MMKIRIQNLELRIKVIWLSLLAALFFILYSLFSHHLIFAQACPVQNTSPRVQDGLISTADIDESKVGGTNKFGSNTGKCVVDSKASFAPFKIPTYEDLKSLYYTQAKTKTGVVIKETPITAASATEANIPLTTGSDHLYLVSGNLEISSNISGGQSGIIFVEGNLTINPTNHKIETLNNKGLVFVVKGNIYIDPTVTQIDAVLISQGIIYTAGANCATSSVDKLSNGTTPISPLTIKGSLISLNQVDTTPIKFCRTLGATNQTAAAEIINQQPKYLVILKDLLSDTLQKWSEIQ